MKTTLAYVIVGMCILFTVVLYISRQTHVYEAFYTRNIHYLDPPDVARLVQGPSLFSRSLQSYIDTLDHRTIQNKCGTGDYLQGFQSSLVKWTQKDRDIIRKRLRKLPDSSLVHGDWSFILTDGELEHGMPFTLGTVVVLPSPLERISVDTLCHERMHVLQRLYPEWFDNMARKMGYHQVVVADDHNSPLVSFANPDGLQKPHETWAIEHRGHLYCPQLILVDNRLKKIGVRLQQNHSSWIRTNDTLPLQELMQDHMTSCPMGQRYHPYEILAELGAHYLMQGTSGSSEVDHLYQSLEGHMATQPLHTLAE
jgi:hypothetical protein